jgi:hypothetical protein
MRRSVPGLTPPADEPDAKEELSARSTTLHSEAESPLRASPPPRGGRQGKIVVTQIS